MVDRATAIRLVRDVIRSLACEVLEANSKEIGSTVDLTEIHTMQDRESIRYLCKLAGDDNLPESILQHLINHPSAQVREAVCDNPGLTLVELRILARDQNPDVRYALSENHNMPLCILNQLAEDENPYVSCRAQKTLNRLQITYGFGKKVFDLENTIHMYRNPKLEYSL